MSDYWVDVTIRLRKKVLITNKEEKPKYPDVLKTLKDKYGFAEVELTADDVFIDNVAKMV